MQQYEEQMKKEGTYKKDTAPRPLLKSTEKWDGRPETLAKQKREAKARAEEQKKKETQEIIKEMERRERELAKRRSLGSSEPRISRSMENVNTFGDGFGFEVHSTSTLGSQSSNNNSNQRPQFPPTQSYQSDYSGGAKSYSEGGSMASDGESQRGRTSLRHEGSTKSLSSSSLSDISPFMDRDLPGLPEIPPEHRHGKISKPLPAIPFIVPHRHVLPTVIEPPDESSPDPPIRAVSVSSPVCGHPTDPALIVSTLPTPPDSAELRGESLSPSESINSVAAISPLDEEVVVKSSGAHILGPPPTVKRKVPHVPFLAGEAQEMKLPDEYSSPPSILKSKYATSRRMSLPSRPLIPDRSNRAECAAQKPSEASRFRQPPGTAIKGDSLPRKDTEAKEGERYEPERNTTPTPAPGGRGLFRSGRLGLFAKDKNER
jgi:hypothetical protein